MAIPNRQHWLSLDDPRPGAADPAVVEGDRTGIEGGAELVVGAAEEAAVGSDDAGPRLLGGQERDGCARCGEHLVPSAHHRRGIDPLRRLHETVELRLRIPDPCDELQQERRIESRVLAAGRPGQEAKTSKNFTNSKSSQPNEWGVYVMRKELRKTNTDKTTGKPFTVVVRADRNGDVFEVFDLFPK